MTDQITTPIRKQGFGHIVGSASYRVLHLLRSNPGRTFTGRELAEALELPKSAIKPATNNGVLSGCLSKHAEERGMAFRFEHMPQLKPLAPRHSAYKPTGKPGGRPKGTVTRAAGPGKTSDRKTAEKLEVRQRLNALNPIKPMTPVDPVPHSAAKKVTVRENYPPHRYWTDPAKVPSHFSLIPLGATLEAA